MDAITSTSRLPLFGAPSRPLVTEEEIGCPRCGKFGCEHEQPPRVSVTPKAGVCPVCHRGLAACLCASHVDYTPERYTKPEEEEQATRQLLATPRERIEHTVREFRRCWYDTRDARRAEEIVRELAEKVYVA